MATITQTQPRRKADWGKAVRESRIPWLFILPSAIVMALVTLYPQLYQIDMSFTNYDQSHTAGRIEPDNVGIDNFSRVLQSEIPISNYDFLRILSFNMLWAVINVAIHVSIGVAVAILLNAKDLLFRRFYRAIFVLAWAMPQYIAALVWHNAFEKDSGIINLLIAEINGFFGTKFATNTDWLVKETPPIDIPGVPLIVHLEGLGLNIPIPADIFEIFPLGFYAVLVANIWFGWPFMMIVATGALQSIPKELYEAADVDGASKWRQFWSITVPMIRPAMIPAVMLGTIWTFNGFNVIYFITGGGPSHKTEILVTQSYTLLNDTSISGRYGLAAAFSLVVFVILFVITLINNYITRATEAYNE